MPSSAPVNSPDKTPVITLVNGQLCDQLATDDRGLAYGDGLFETLLSNNGKPALLEWHMRRLQLGCERLAINLDYQGLRTDIGQLLTHCRGRSIIKIIVTRKAAGRGYKPQRDAGSNRVLSIAAHSVLDQRQQLDGVSLRLCSHRLPINPALAGIKHLSRLDNVLARAEWESQEIAEGLMLDSDGRIVEGTMSNIFAVRDRQLLTPSLHRCGVAGVVRQFIVEVLAPELDMEVGVGDLLIDDLLGADELFICNSVIGIWPVRKFACHHKPVGPITCQLQRQLDLQRSVTEAATYV